MVDINKLVEGMYMRLVWIRRTQYMLTDEQKEELVNIANKLAEIENDVNSRA